MAGLYNESSPPPRPMDNQAPTPSKTNPTSFTSDAVAECLSAVGGLCVERDVVLARSTRFGIGGPAAVYVDTSDASAFAEALDVCQREHLPHYVLGEGTNVIVADEGYPGVILRYSGNEIRHDGHVLEAEAGAVLMDLVNASLDASLEGIETLAGIPGWVGGAVYGNAGAYGRSMHESVVEVDALDAGRLRTFTNAECDFAYRESVFKQRKDWVIVRARLELTPGAGTKLRARSDEIVSVRNEKFPPTMRCAGSIFKNLRLSDLPQDVAERVPERAVRGGKVASAFFLEKVGAKGMREGGIEIASYHANLIYNSGAGTAAELRCLIAELKRRVQEEFGFAVDEEVQYVGPNAW